MALFIQDVFGTAFKCNVFVCPKCVFVFPVTSGWRFIETGMNLFPGISSQHKLHHNNDGY